jgi:hypothetical protein
MAADPGLPDTPDHPSAAEIVASTIAKGPEFTKAWLGLSKLGGSSDRDG